MSAHRADIWTLMTALIWLNDLPLWQCLAILGGGAILLSIAGTIVARRFFSEQQLLVTNFTIGFRFFFIANLYAGFLSFLLFGAFQRYDHVRADVVAEANALGALDTLAGAFPAGARDQFRLAVRDYARTVVNVEWSQMRERNAELGRAAPLDTLYYVFGAAEPVSKKQQAVMRHARDLVGEVRDMRGARVLRSLGSLQILLWAVTIAGTLGAIIVPWFFGTTNPGSAFFMSACSIAVMISIVVVILKLSYPFGGSQGIEPTPYLAFLHEQASQHDPGG
jgi:hypothetical protein